MILKWPMPRNNTRCQGMIRRCSREAYQYDRQNEIRSIYRLVFTFTRASLNGKKSESQASCKKYEEGLNH